MPQSLGERLASSSDLRHLIPNIDLDRLMPHSEKFGVAGYGGRGKLIARRLVELGFSVLGIHDPNPAQLVNAPHRTFSDLDEMLRLDLDALFIASWPSSHAEIAEKALERGIDVFVEKPMGASRAQSRRIVEAQERAGRLVVVGYIERMNPAIIKLREIADMSEIIRSRETRVGMAPPTSNAPGILRDLGSHGIDIAYHLFHAVPKVRSSNLAAEKEGDPGYECIVELEYGNVRSCVEARYSTIRRRRLELDTEQDYFVVNYTPASLKFGFAPPKLRKRPQSFADLEQLSRNVEMELDIPRVEPINVMLLLFAGSVRQGGLIEPLCSAQEALITAEALEDAEQMANYKIIPKKEPGA